MRLPGLVASLLLSAAGAAVFEAPGCLPCGGANNNIAMCFSSFEITAHVPRSASALQGGRVTLCRSEGCASGTIRGDADGGSDYYFNLTGADNPGIVLVDDEGDGYTKLTLQLGVSPVKGDSYAVTVTAPDGSVLLKVSRPVSFTTVTEGCPSVTCYQAALDVYPTSQSGLLCGAAGCTGGIVLHASLVTADGTDPVTVTACRNGACGSVTVPLPATSTDGGFEPPSVGTIVTGYPGQVSITSGPSQDYSMQVYRTDDSAALANGDAYSLTVTQGQSTLVSWAAPVTYVETYPDGEPCDAVPCRSAEVVIAP